MPLEQTIEMIIREFGSTLWIGFITLVITGFVLSSIRSFIDDLIYYFKARFSDIGYGQRVYYQGEIYLVKEVRFKYIVIYDDKKTIRIPTKSYMSGPIAFPQPRYDDFDEEKYHEPPWDGATERRSRPEPSPKNGGGGAGAPFDAESHRRDIVDTVLAIVLGPDRMKELFPQLPDNVYHDAKRRAGKLTERDFQRIHSMIQSLGDNISIFEELNAAGVSLTQDDIAKVKRTREDRYQRSAEA